jgi:NAD(P)-dependent dehydrogenase (short-subunit alcohol dehydrogenase family)
MKTIQGRKILITGAAMGMGRLYAERAVREGAAVVILWDINQEELERTVLALKDSGVRLMPYLVDIGSLDAIVAASARVRADVGDPHIIINNAGIVRGKYFWEHSQADTRLTMEINALAPMYITREFLPAMMASRRECRIVTIASAAATVSNPRMSVYCASKWAAVGWSDSLRLELVQAGHSHVKVTTVCPSYVSTGMFEGARGPLMTPVMKPGYVVDRVWRAMLAGRPMLMLPWTVTLGKIARGILPLRAWDWVADHVFGVYHTMDRFKGR